MYVYDNPTAQPRYHGRHLFNLLLWKVIAANLHRLMKLPVHMHVLDHSSKDSTNTNRDVVFILETDFLERLDLLRCEKLRIMNRGWQLRKIVLLELLQ